MKYRGEAYQDRVILHSRNMVAPHPNNVAKNIIKETLIQNPNADYIIIGVVSERGERWIYSVKREGAKTNVHLVEKTSFILNKTEVSMIFSGNVGTLEV